MPLNDVVDDFIFELTCVAEIHVLDFWHDCEHLDVVLSLEFCSHQ